MSKSAIAIRRAVLDDAETLSKLSATTFTQTFGHLYAPVDLATFLATAYRVEKYAGMLTDPSKALWLVEDDSRAVGYALAMSCDLPHPDVAPGDGEVKRLYLLADYQRAGIGTRLFETALEWLLSDGDRQLWLGVWSENYGAQRFYNRYGFFKAGEYNFPVGDHLDREFIYRRQVSAS